MAKLGKRQDTTLSHREEWGPKEVKQFTTGELPANGQATNGRDKKQGSPLRPPLREQMGDEDVVSLPDHTASQAGPVVLQSGQQPKGKEKPKSDWLKCQNTAGVATWCQLIHG